MDITYLNNKFGIQDSVEFITGAGGFTVAKLSHQFGTASVSLYGGQVLSYIPNNEHDVFWMSSKSFFENGKPIRGGIPICFPWFGPHSNGSTKPQHGFARLELWEVTKTTVLPNGNVQIVLSLKDNARTKLLWQYQFLAEIIVTLGDSLEVTFRCTNTGKEQFSYTDALHSYFAVKDVSTIKIVGLGGSEYFDGIGSKELKKQTGDVLTVLKEENRRYINTSAECTIIDPGFSRIIRIEKKGSNVTVVWNPWETTSKNIADMEPECYKTMICIEPVNAYDDVVVLEPGESSTLSTIVTVEK